MTPEYISNNMRYVLPTATNVCSYTTLAKTTDAIKAIVHTVNMKFRKLKKNNVRNTNRT